MRILWVVPRFGPDVVGGAETLVRALALRAVPDGWRTEVATTCALDHVTWGNALPAGTTRDAGLTVHRFPVGSRDEDRFAQAHGRVMSGAADYADAVEWLAQSVRCPAMETFLEDDDRADLVLLAPYLFGTTVWGAAVAPGRAALVPCLHDEPYARLAPVTAMLGAVRGCMFNAPGEERLARRLAHVRDGGVVGSGIDPAPHAAAVPAELSALGPYLVYAGRLEEGKGVHVLVEHVARMRREDPSLPRLVLVGRGGYAPPRAARDHVVRTGYLDEEAKRGAFAGALALVNASALESLSLVQLEAWREGTPCIVNAGSEVMADHVAAGGGGFTFDGYAAFRDAVRALRDDPALRTDMGRRGREYVLDVYGWPAVRRRFRETAERLAP